jgi:phosphoadenosine phosphosulfate reductase
MINSELLIKLSQKAQGLKPEDIIQLAYDTFGDKIVFASSLGEEDQVITDMISKVAPRIGIFTLDTGRLYQETYDLLAKSQRKYHNLRFDVYFPDTKAVEAMVRSNGINLFYESVENRKLCCGIRKVEPLKRALTNVDAWIVGLRKEQAVTRGDIQNFEWDTANNKIKINPLADWTLAQVRSYINEHHVDVNPLHAQGYISIGCSPCTRAVKEGEDIRAGRWWWENPEQKECGLHNNPKWAKNRKS